METDDLAPTVPDAVAPGDLTEKQRLFVAAYLENPNATQAAVKAGYSEKTAGVIGYENLQKPQILAVLNAARTEREQRTKVNADLIVQRLWAEANDFVLGTPASRTTALDKLAKHYGLYESHNRQKVPSDPAAEAERIRRRLAERGIDVDRLFPKPQQ